MCGFGSRLTPLRRPTLNVPEGTMIANFVTCTECQQDWIVSPLGENTWRMMTDRPSEFLPPPGSDIPVENVKETIFTITEAETPVCPYCGGELGMTLFIGYN